MRTRAGLVRSARVSSPSMIRFLFPRGQRNLHLYQSPTSGFAVELEGSAEQGHPLAYAGEPNPLAWSTPVRLLGRSKAAPPILHTKPYRSPHVLECNVHSLGPGVLAHVGQRFLGNPEQGGLYSRRG